MINYNVIKLCLIFLMTTTQLYCQKRHEIKEIFFVGHAYGSPKKKDKTINAELKNFIDKNKNSFIIWGGDFIQDCNDYIEIKNFKNISNQLNNRYVLGNHDNCNSILKNILRNKNTNSFEIINKNLFIYLDTNFKDLKIVDQTLKFTLDLLKNNKYENIFIFSHQAIFSTSKFRLLTNSRSDYSLANFFYTELKKTMLNSKKKFHLFSGDIGAFDYMPFAFYEKEKNISKYAVGLGNNKNHKIIIIKGDEVKFYDLITNKTENLENYNAAKIRLTYLPRLIQLFVKENLIITSIIFSAFLFAILWYRLWVKREVA